MKATLVVVSLVLSLAAEAAAEPAGALRPLDAAAADVLARGREVSAAFRGLCEALDRAHVVVHVMSGATDLFAAAGTTRLAGVADGWRYIRIVFDQRLRADERVAVVAHELQHAREIAEADIRTQADARRLYERIGRRVRSAWNAFETDAAADIGVRVLREYRAASGDMSVPRFAPRD